jgi:hypothetical protein
VALRPGPRPAAAGARHGRRRRDDPPPRPDRGFGVLLGPGRLLNARAADPAGGPPWALRLVKTSRGFACVQLGRLVGGKLGILGRDGTFHDDGRFHETGPTASQMGDCQQTDAAGHAFIASEYIGYPDSGASGCGARSSPGDPRPLCPAGSLRNLFYGLLGPAVRAITYVDATGRVVRQAIRRPLGAYLVVRATEPGRVNVGYFSPGVTPVSGLLAVEYRDGTTCRVGRTRRAAGGRQPCPLKGYATPQLLPAPRTALAAPIHVRVGTRPLHPHPAGAPRGAAERRITVRFRARRAADARSFYTVDTRSLHAGNGACPYGMLAPIARDLSAGTLVTHTFYILYRCHTTLRISVGYVQQRRPSAMPFSPSPFGNAKVGTVTVRVR